MELSFTLYQEIVEFLKSLPNIHDDNSQKALIYSAGLDARLLDQIKFNLPPEQFFQFLVFMLRGYGTLEDGRDALESVLEAAKKYVGKEKEVLCEELIQNLRVNEKEQPQLFSPQKKKSKVWQAVMLTALFLIIVIIVFLVQQNVQMINSKIQIPDSVREELSMSFLEKIERIGATQKGILNTIVKEFSVHGAVSQDMLQEAFADSIPNKSELYYRLEQLRFLGFIEREQIGDRGGKPHYTYRLSPAYQKEIEKKNR